MEPDQARKHIQETLTRSNLLAELTYEDGIPVVSIQHLKGVQLGSIQLHPSMLDGEDEQVFSRLDKILLATLRVIAQEPILKELR